ncbi:MAG: DUF4189 domain-containing protein [Pseudomonadota bacterium]
MRFIQLCLGILCLLLFGGIEADAFVVEGPKEKAPSAKAHLDRAPRWGLSAGSLVDAGERGLGGGLEYAVDDSVCQMRFVDGSTCLEIKAALQDALDRWASGHPSLRFVDVTGQVDPAFPLAALGTSAQGAEIDFFGSAPEAFPPFQNTSITGYALFYERPQASLVLTNGQIAKGPIGRIESADVRFNTSYCFYIDPLFDALDNCVHFPSLVLHEVSHALGIGHPEEAVQFNLDSDQVRGNEIKIDCLAPSEGLVVMPDYDGAAVAHGQDVQGPGRWRRGLTWDDVAARDALYPHCGIRRMERASAEWGAFALSADGNMGQATLAGSPREAEERALEICEDQGAPCRLVSSFDNCFAFASAPDGAIGHAKASRSDHARVDAVLACSEVGEACQIVVDFCAYE